MAILMARCTSRFMVAEALSGLANTCGHSVKSRLLVITVAWTRLLWTRRRLPQVACEATPQAETWCSEIRAYSGEKSHRGSGPTL